MKQSHILALAAVTASLLVACGGSHTGSSPGTAPALAATTGSATSYASVKWGGGGYVTGLVYHPTSYGVLYARTDVGGAYRWNNSNGSWTPITDGIGFNAGESTYHGVESIALDPTNDNKVYLVTGMYSHDWQGNPINGRIYVSGDRGNTWSHYDLPFPVGGNENARAIGERLKLDPTNPSTMFYATRTAGLWKSTDSGQHWTQTGLSGTVLTAAQIKALGNPVGVEQIMFDNSNVGGGATTWIMYAAIAPDYVQAAGLTSTLYKSVNGGANWTPVTVPSTVAGYYVPHMVRNTDGTYYVVFNKNAGQGAQGPGYLYRFNGMTNNDTWSAQPLASSTQGGYGGVSVSGTGSTARIALAVTGTWGANNQVVQLSDNGGGSWREIAGGMQHWGAEFWGWVDDIEIDPTNSDHIMYVTGGGIWETWNASSATPGWDAPVNNVEETATLALVTPPAGASYKLVNSAGDIGTWVQTDLTAKPTRGPTTSWSNGNAADVLWSDSTYIVGAGVMSNASTGFGFWSGDSGSTWSNFASLPTGAATQLSNAASIVTTSRGNIVWAPANSVPSWTTNGGASWTSTGLPTPAGGLDNGYHLVVDRKNPNKVYAYDGGGAWWNSGTAKVYVSVNAGQSFSLIQGSVSANFAPNAFGLTSLVANPNAAAEGDLWLVDGNAVYHSTNSGSSWTKLSGFATVPANGSTGALQGASAIALGKPLAGSSYSAAIYVVGTRNGVWGIYHSDDGGATWARFNDDAHQYGGVGAIAGDWNTYGRIYFSGTARGVIYTN